MYRRYSPTYVDIVIKYLPHSIFDVTWRQRQELMRVAYVYDLI